MDFVADSVCIQPQYEIFHHSTKTFAENLWQSRKLFVFLQRGSVKIMSKTTIYGVEREIDKSLLTNKKQTKL